MLEREALCRIGRAELGLGIGNWWLGIGTFGHRKLLSAVSHLERVIIGVSRFLEIFCDLIILSAHLDQLGRYQPLELCPFMPAGREREGASRVVRA